jgi:hypothetical protein
MILKHTAQLLVLIAAMVIPYLSIRYYSKKKEPPVIRSLPALNMIPEMIGRAAEMNAKVLVIPGYSGTLDARLLSGLSILTKASEEAVIKGASVVIPTARGVFMPLIEAAATAGFTAAGRTDLKADIRFLTDQQFAFAAGVMGLIQRENCQANFYVGGFADECLPITSAGMAIGAVQIAGDTNMYQLPYFVCTCDYVMIAEEFLVSGVVLSKDKEQLGGVIGADYLKYFLLLLGVLGVIAASFGSDIIIQILNYGG